jgi:hypothetical protein
MTNTSSGGAHRTNLETILHSHSLSLSLSGVMIYLFTGYGVGKNHEKEVVALVSRTRVLQDLYFIFYFSFFFLIL